MNVAIPSCSSSNVNLPVIVYSNSWLGQTAAIGSSTVFSVTEDALYRVSLSAKVTGNPATTDVTPVVTWTSQDGVSFTAHPNGNGTGWSDALFLGHNGDSVGFHSNINGSPTYDVRVAIEQL